MIKGMSLLVAGFLAVTSFPAFTQASAVMNQRHHIGLSHLDRMKPNGEFVVYTFKDDKWQEAGSLSFNKYFREKNLDLGHYLTGDNSVKTKIRLQQKGGGAAHIDSVLLGGRPPTEAVGADFIKKKVSGKDHDVIDAFERELEFTFPASRKDTALRLTARVEAIHISKTPFQFPQKNLYKQIDEKADFYTYKLNHEDAVERPLFKEFSRTGSGHPSGYTYGWVSNDQEYLYARIDFTPDNTMDGDKDYAKLYVKTEAGLIKEFKVSVPETKWGKPDFTYTDKAAYQHKVYDFKIPLSELDITEVKKEKELRLAFASYGTAAPPPLAFCIPSIAYDPENNRYLVVSPVLTFLDFDIYGQLFNPDGTPYGNAFAISTAKDVQWFPSVAYDSKKKRFLAVWEDVRNGNDFNIYGQLINADGSLKGNNFFISKASDDQSFPAVAYDGKKQVFLVVWEDWRNVTDGDVYGRRVKSDGSLKGPAFVISNAANNQGIPALAYDSKNKRFLVTWADIRSGSSIDIYGQLLNRNGSLEGTNFVISNAADDQLFPSVAFDGKNKRFLVVWYDYRNVTDADVYGQLVDADGPLYGADFAISNAPDDQVGPSVAYNSANRRFLVVWEDWRSGVEADVYGQRVKANGKLTGINFAISGAVDDQMCPAVATNSVCANYLTTFISWEMNFPEIDAAAVGGGCCLCPENDIKGCISGAVTDIDTGAPLAGAYVRLRRLSPKLPNDLKSWKQGKWCRRSTRNAETDGNGCFIFEELRDGRYDVFVVGQGRAIGGKGRHHFPVEILHGGKVNHVNFERR